MYAILKILSVSVLVSILAWKERDFNKEFDKKKSIHFHYYGSTQIPQYKELDGLKKKKKRLSIVSMKIAYKLKM